MHSEFCKNLTYRSHLPRILVTTVLASLACQASLAGGVPKETFPRLGGYHIGATPYEGAYTNPEYQKQIARLDFAVIGSSLTARNADAAAIRQLNPNIILVKYTSLQSVSSTFLGYPEIKRNKASAERGPNQTNARDWWARDFSGNHVSNWPNNWTVNITRWVKPDANGDRYPEWAAKLDYNRWIKYPAWDGVFEDAVYWQPRTPSNGVSIDWSGGQESDSNKIKSEFRLGHQSYWNQMLRLAPDKYIVVNHDWYRSENASALGRWDLPEFDQKVHGGVLEVVMRSSDLVGKPRTGWNTVMKYYERSMSYFLDPDLVLFIVSGEPNNYRFLRYSFATCLLNNGYFDYAPIGNEQYGTVEWFDEFDLAGAADTNWLGRALAAPPEAAWQSGVWRRDFQGGVALANPRGNGIRTVTVEQGLRRIAGRQDQQVNNGRPADRITLQDGDGIILVREGFADLPEPEVTPKPPVIIR